MTSFFVCFKLAFFHILFHKSLIVNQDKQDKVIGCLLKQAEATTNHMKQRFSQELPQSPEVGHFFYG